LLRWNKKAKLFPMKTDSSPIIVSQSFDTSPQKVWVAITDVAQMRQWFFDNIPTFAAKVGFSTEFMVETPDRKFLHQWKITEVVPGKKIVYSWSYAEYPGHGTVSFDVSSSDTSTILTLTAEGMESFPQDIPEFSRESCTQGWNYFIKERLFAFLTEST